METPLTFPELINEMYAANPRLNYRPERLPFVFRGREVSLGEYSHASNNLLNENMPGYMRLSFFHVAETSEIVSNSGAYLSATYSYPMTPDSPTRDAVHEASRCVSSLSISTKTRMGGVDSPILTSPTFAAQARTFPGLGKGKTDEIYQQFDPNDPFVKLLHELLMAINNVIDVQGGIAEAIRDLGLLKTT